MNYLNYAYPQDNYQQSDRSADLRDEWLALLSTLFRPDYVSSMLATVHGTSRLKKLSNWLTRSTTKLDVIIQNGPLNDDRGNLVHGTTQAAGEYYNGIDVIIATFAGVPDRMNGWSADELINIVGVHESFHIKLDGRKIEVVECLPLFAKCHFLVIQEEFKARLEYSLVDPDQSTSKSDWLANYQFYFDIAYRLEKILSDPTYKNTAYCDEIDKEFIKKFDLYHAEKSAAGKTPWRDPPSRRASMGEFEETDDFADYRQQRALKDYFVEGINLSDRLFFETIDESYQLAHTYKAYVDVALREKVFTIFNNKNNYSLAGLK